MQIVATDAENDDILKAFLAPVVIVAVMALERVTIGCGSPTRPALMAIPL